MTVFTLIVALMAGPDIPQGNCLALGNCCCVLDDGTQCCARSGNCASGIVPGCSCADRS